MYLKRMELQGFKSFADRTILEFKPGITTVIGPNGSGKSNISDAIRWALGEQSIKSLRGNKSEDIIFAGTQSRKSLGFAEVSLIFDNTDGKLPVEYEEVTVTRRLYRSGETGYYINKAQCRLKDVLELFMDTGIGKDGYSIIGQGKIDEILSNKSEDRRHIFEEAAGIVKYRTRKEESEKKLERAKLNLLRINDILQELENNIDPLKLQAEKAKKFLALREELKNIEVGMFLYNIKSYKEKLVQTMENLDIMNSTYEEAKKVQNENNSKKAKLKLEINELLEKIEKMQNIGFESSTKIEKLKSDINVSDERIKNIGENSQSYANEIKELKEKIKELNDEKNQKSGRKESLLANKEKFSNELKEKEEELKKLTSKLSDKELEIENKKKNLEANTDEKYELQNLLTEYEVKKENLKKDTKKLENELNVTISDLDRSRLKKSEIEKNFTQIENERKGLRKELQNFEKTKADSDKKIADFNTKINNILYNAKMKESRLNFLKETEREKEGYAKAIKSLLNAGERNPSIKNKYEGVVASLLTVPKEYEIAIEMALGASMQNVVCQTSEEAKFLIDYLRSNNLGRATFLPIESMKGNKANNINASGVSGYIGIASDLIKFNPKYNSVFQNLLGRVAITKDMESGLKLAKMNKYGFRIVTLKGDIISQSGSMTGGSVQNKTVNILGRAREIESLESEIKNLLKEKENVEKEKDNYENSISDILEEIQAGESKLQETEINYATSKQKFEAITDDVQNYEKRKEKINSEISQIKTDLEEIENKKQETQEKLAKISEENQKLSEEIEEFVKLNKDDQNYIDNLNIDITNLKISVTSFEESENSIKEFEQRIEEDIKATNKNIENKQNQIEINKDEEIKLKEKIENLNKEILKIKEEAENSDQKIVELKKAKENKNNALEELEKAIEAQIGRLEELRDNLNKITNKKEGLNKSIEDIINKMWDEYEITPNTSEKFKEVKNISATERDVSELRAQIKDLGSVNIDSIEEYQKLKERYDFMSEQRLDLENSMKKLHDVISEMLSLMQKQFKERFNQINKNFNEVFIELFGGGKAELILEDEKDILNCGIDIRVQPPGKKLQNMTLLSGGEKAFTAIAILFAILKINPAPFCVLDEIEAALDDANVVRYAEYLKKFAKDTQFLVITHRKGTMEVANTVYGITMEERGISKLLSLKLKEARA